jgi:LEA14-like dessication related protein
MSILIVLLAAGCGVLFTSFSFSDLTYQQPKITYVRLDVKKVTFEDTQVNFVYSVENPNVIGLSGIKVDYALYLGQKDEPGAKEAPTATGKDVTFSIGARTTSPFVLPMTINYVGFFHSADKLTQIILSGKKTIPFVLKTVFHLELAFLKFSIPVTVHGELPLPEVAAPARLPSISSIHF